MLVLNFAFIRITKKIPRYSGELARQIANHFIALHHFQGVFVHGVVKLSFSNKFFSMASIRLDKHDIHAQLMLSLVCPDLLNDCVVTKKKFCIVLLRFFSANSIVFISTVGFSNEDNCCQSQSLFPKLCLKVGCAA